MAKIAQIDALEILDSRGNPTLQVTVTTDEGTRGTAAVPSGASTGEHEALELRDGDPKRYFGKGVLKAAAHIHGPLAKLLIGMDVSQQQEIDHKMIAADGTENKAQFGANALLGISLAVAKAGALTVGKPLFRYLAVGEISLPIPMMNIINGGMHADNPLEIQEFMIRPIAAPSFAEGLRWGAEIFHTLKGLLQKQGYTTSVGDEGGFAPALASNEAVLDVILQAIESAGYLPEKQVTLALDCAASEFFREGTYAGRSSKEQVDLLENLVCHYPIDSIEDGMAENDWEGWKELSHRLGNIQLVGDDLFVTNPRFLKRGIEEGIANAILIKLNQIGTLTETLDCIAFAKKHSYGTIISHRSGETEDTTIADLAVATSAGQIKTGSLSRSDRTAKYNRLLSIEKAMT